MTQLKSSATDDELEETLNFQLEELTVMAKKELELVDRMAEWRPWEVPEVHQSKHASNNSATCCAIPMPSEQEGVKAGGPHGRVGAPGRCPRYSDAHHASGNLQHVLLSEHLGTGVGEPHAARTAHPHVGHCCTAWHQHVRNMSRPSNARRSRRTAIFSFLDGVSLADYPLPDILCCRATSRSSSRSKMWQSGRKLPASDRSANQRQMTCCGLN